MTVATKAPALLMNGNGLQSAQPMAEQMIAQPVEPVPYDEQLTDLGNARRFARLHSEDLRYTIATGWLVWTGTHWKRDETGQVSRLAKKVVTGLHNEAAARLRMAANLVEEIGTLTEGDPRLAKLKEKASKTQTFAKQLGDWALKSQSRDRISAMIALAETELPIATHIDQFDKNTWLFNVRNGTINLKSGRLHPHERTDLITKYADVDFDPKAVCPKFLAFLRRIMGGNQALVDFLQRSLGYSMTGEVKTNDLFFSHGTGANGKSTLFEVVTAAMGDYWLKSPTEMLMAKDHSGGIPNDVARLRGVRMTIVAEVNQGQRLDEKMVKDLTGGDTLTARFMRQEYFDFKPTHKVWMYGNHKPEVRGRDHGIWRRVHLIPFTVTIPEKEQNPNLKYQLIAEELPGILAWLVKGCSEWQKSGLCVPEEVKAATEEYRAEGNTLARFIDECAVTNPKAKVKAGRFQEEYKRFCHDAGLKPLRGNELWNELEKLGITKETTMFGVQYTGIGLLAAEITLKDER